MGGLLIPILLRITLDNAKVDIVVEGAGDY